MKSGWRLRSWNFLLLSMASFGANAQYVDVSDALNLYVDHTDGYLGSGISVVDFNGDGWDDLSVCQHSGTIHFFTGNGMGGFNLTSLGIDNGDADAKSISWVDLDNDGDQDLFITNRLATNRLWMNNGEEGFEETTYTSGINTEERKSYGASFADLDNDGDLDLFVANYNMAFLEMLNELYTNNGDGTFTEVTISAGLGQDVKQTFLAEWTDLNEDGLMDLYLIRDRHIYANMYYENQGDGTFIDAAAAYGLDITINAMCSAIGDYNRDGAMDVYVSGLQNENVLLSNNGAGVFMDQGSDAFDIFHTCWSGTWVDWDNDSWQELHIATGTSEYTDYPNILTGVDQIADSMFEYIDGEWFAIAGTGLNPEHSFAVTATDVNGDGFQDLLSCPIGEMASVYLATPNENNFLRIRGEGVTSNRDAIGVKYRLYLDGEVLYRMSKSGEGYLVQGSRWQHFGLGSAEIADSLFVTWPTGTTDVYYDIPANSSFLVVEGAMELVCASGNCNEAAVEGCTYALATNFDGSATFDDGSCVFGPTPISCGVGTMWDPGSFTCIPISPGCAGDANGDGYIGIADLLMLLEVFATFCPD